MGQAFSHAWNQSFFIPPPKFTEKELPDQAGKVHIITGGYTGIGFELARLVYPKNATVYLAGRSPSKAQPAIEQLKKEFPASKGKLEFLKLDLADLSSIKASTEEFLKKESRLDVLMNNAGVMIPPVGSKSAQNYDLQTATNIYGPYLFTLLLYPLLKETAKKAETGTVRVSWAASLAAELTTPKGCLQFAKNAEGQDVVNEKLNNVNLYGQSKAANVMLGVECAKRWGGDGILSNSFNPGNLKSELQRYASWFERVILGPLLHPVKMGGYTELAAGWSPDITPEKSGCYVVPWGRIAEYHDPLKRSIKPNSEGGEGRAEKLWEVCERVVKPYM